MNSKKPKTYSFKEMMDTVRVLKAHHRNHEEVDLTPIKKGPQKLVRKILWSDEAQGLAVVAGPFPYNFVRSMTRDTVVKASRLSTWDIQARSETTLTDQYALVRLKDITEEPEENDFGPVMP